MSAARFLALCDQPPKLELWLEALRATRQLDDSWFQFGYDVPGVILAFDGAPAKDADFILRTLEIIEAAASERPDLGIFPAALLVHASPELLREESFLERLAREHNSVFFCIGVLFPDLKARIGNNEGLILTALRAGADEAGLRRLINLASADLRANPEFGRKVLELVRRTAGFPTELAENNWKKMIARVAAEAREEIRVARNEVMRIASALGHVAAGRAGGENMGSAIHGAAPSVRVVSKWLQAQL